MAKRIIEMEERILDNKRMEMLKQAFLAGMESFEYTERTCVPYEDCFDQWVEHMEKIEWGEV